MTDEATLRIAAICAVLAVVETQGEDPSLAGRKQGPSWTKDHIRMNMGLNSLINRNSARSPWR